MAPYNEAMKRLNDRTKRGTYSTTLPPSPSPMIPARC